MRNAQTFKVARLFELNVRPEVSFKKFSVLVTQNIDSNWSSVLYESMRRMLEFCEHRLAVKCCQNVAGTLGNKEVPKLFVVCAVH